MCIRDRACDLAVAADDARFTMAYARIGATPDLGGTYRLARLVGQRKAREIALLAETFGAEEALKIGLINRVVPVADARDEALALARKLAAGPTGAYGRIRTLLTEALDADLAEMCIRDRVSEMAGSSPAMTANEREPQLSASADIVCPSTWPRLRSGSSRSRTRCFSTLESGKPPSTLRSQINSPS